MRHRNEPPVERICQQCQRPFTVLKCLVRFWEARGMKAGLFCSRKCTGNARTGHINIERFNENWIGEPNSGCWLWTGPMQQSFGYGKMGHSKRKATAAHIISHLLHKGPVEKGAVVRHLCNNPSCVNPDHLAVGTPADNMDDMVRSGRSLKGTKNHNALLTEEVVAAIKAQLVAGREQTVIAAEHGVWQTAIQKIYCGESWRHVPWPEGSDVGPDGIRRSKAEAARSGRRAVIVSINGQNMIVGDALKWIGRSRSAYYFLARSHGWTAQEVFNFWLAKDEQSAAQTYAEAA